MNMYNAYHLKKITIEQELKHKICRFLRMQNTYHEPQ